MSETIKLINGVEIPVVGFGTFRNREEDECRRSIQDAINAGYRHIDTAKAYRNETFVGEAIKQSGVPRNELFITTKLLDSDQGYDTALAAFDEQLKALGLDYLDLYLIHWPTEKSGESWKALERLYKEKRVRAIGISNFYRHHIDELLSDREITPHINQLERHPFFVQTEYQAYLRKLDIAFEAYAPLAQGSTAFVPREGGPLLENPVLLEIAKKYNRTPAQIVIRWNIQSEIVVIPKSVKPERIRENFAVFDFKLSDEDITKISALDEGRRVSWYPENFHL
jgi:diketogulonate reductase-like aldo/keto reductase